MQSLRTSILRSLLLAVTAWAGVACSPALADSACSSTIVMPPGVGIGTASDITTLNNMLSESLYSTEAGSLLYPNLLWMDENNRIDYSRSQASRIDVAEDGALYTVTLRPWQWSDGQPVTADDFLYDYELIKAFGVNYTNYGVGGIPDMVKRVTVIDPLHFQVELTHKANPMWFIMNGLGVMTALPRHSWGRYSTDQLWQQQSDPRFFQVVDGPFKIDELKIGRYALMSPNPSWPLARANYARLLIKFVESDGQALQGVQSGEIDLANLPFSVYDAGSRIPGVRMVHAKAPLINNYIGLNYKDPNSPQFHDVRVRQAIADAIDQAAIVATAFHGQGVEMRNPVPPSVPDFLSPAVRAGKQPVSYDPARSRALLDTAGWKMGPDGYRHKDGKIFTLTAMVASNQEYRIAMAEMVQQQLRAVGIDFRIKQMDFNQIIAAIAEHVAPWQAYILGSTYGAYPSGEILFTTNGVQNFDGYSDPKMDQIIAQSTNEPGLAGLWAYEDYAAEQQPEIFLPLEVDTILERNNISGAEQLNTPAIGWWPQYLHLDLPASCAGGK